MIGGRLAVVLFVANVYFQTCESPDSVVRIARQPSTMVHLFCIHCNLHKNLLNDNINVAVQRTVLIEREAGQAMQLMGVIEQAAELLKAMGNERRLIILTALSEGERSVGELEGIVDLSQSALSQHLARLRRDGLVRTRRDAQTIYYSLKGDSVLWVLRALKTIYSENEASDTGRKLCTHKDDCCMVTSMLSADD